MFSLPRRVYYDNTDAAGVVYHSEYLKWMEQARTEALFSLGVDIASLVNQGVQFVVHRLEAQYHKSARLGEEVVIQSRVNMASPIRLLWEQKVVKNDQVLVTALISIACLDQRWRPLRLPKQITDAVREVS